MHREEITKRLEQENSITWPARSHVARHAALSRVAATVIYQIDDPRLRFRGFHRLIDIERTFETSARSVVDRQPDLQHWSDRRPLRCLQSVRKYFPQTAAASTNCRKAHKVYSCEAAVIVFKDGSNSCDRQALSVSLKRSIAFH